MYRQHHMEFGRGVSSKVQQYGTDLNRHITYPELFCSIQVRNYIYVLTTYAPKYVPSIIHDQALTPPAHLSSTQEDKRSMQVCPPPFCFSRPISFDFNSYNYIYIYIFVISIFAIISMPNA